MIEISFQKQGDDIIAVEVSGHAESDVYGKDIVCAAVSVLVISTINSIDQLLSLDPVVEQESEGGYLYVTFDSNDIQNNQLQLLLRHLELSVQQVQHEYPAYVYLKEQ